MDFWFYFHTLLIVVLSIFNFIQKHIEKMRTKDEKLVWKHFDSKVKQHKPGKETCDVTMVPNHVPETNCLFYRMQ